MKFKRCLMAVLIVGTTLVVPNQSFATGRRYWIRQQMRYGQPAPAYYVQGAGAGTVDASAFGSMMLPLLANFGLNLLQQRLGSDNSTPPQSEPQSQTLTTTAVIEDDPKLLEIERKLRATEAKLGIESPTETNSTGPAANEPTPPSNNSVPSFFPR